MAQVRQATGLKMSTNMCVTRFAHLPEALRLKPIDVLLTDLHYWGGFVGDLALGPIAEVCLTAPWRWTTSGSTSPTSLYHPGAAEPNPALADQFTLFRATSGATGMFRAASGATEPRMARRARAASGATEPLMASDRIPFILHSIDFIMAIFRKWVRSRVHPGLRR